MVLAAYSSIMLSYVRNLRSYSGKLATVKFFRGSTEQKNLFLISRSLPEAA